MAQRQGFGGALQSWADSTFGGAGAWVQGLPEPLRNALGAALALVATGLAVVAVYVMGFRQVGAENLLEHTMRHQLVELVRQQPGIHLREVARRLGLTTTNAAYHLRMLERHHVLRSERSNGKRVYMPAAGPEAKRRYLAQALLQRGPRADLLRTLGSLPGSNQSHLANVTGQHQGAVGWHLRRLMEAGLVEEQRTPRECRYQLTSLGSELCASAPPGPEPQARPAGSLGAGFQGAGHEGPRLGGHA
jgi:predicted transcriptional regulator